MPKTTAFGDFSDEELKNTAFGDLSSTAQARASSTMSVSEMARQRLQGGAPSQLNARTTPEAIKRDPLVPTDYEGPLSSYGIENKLRPAPDTFWNAFKKNLNPVNMLDSSLQAAGNFMPMGSAPNQRPPQDLTAGNLQRDVGAATGIPMPTTFKDTAEESYRRGESGQAQGDMYAGPAAMAAGLGLGEGARAIKPVAHAILPPDIAMEMANRATRSSLGAGPESFAHGATPDIAAGELGVSRSEGRQLKGIVAAKKAAMDTVREQLKNIKTWGIDPMEAVKPVLENTTEHSLESNKIVENFRGKFSQKVSSLSHGTGKVGVLDLHELRKWVDDFVDNYKDDPNSTAKNLFQNVRTALRHQIDHYAPEVTHTNQQIQSLIQAQEALQNKIHARFTLAKTSIGEVRNMLSPMIPSTLVRTGISSLLRAYGQAPEQTLGAAAAGAQGGRPMPGTGIDQKLLNSVPPTQGPQTPTMLGPGQFHVTPEGTAIPPGQEFSGMPGGVAEAPSVVANPGQASMSGAPANIDPARTGELAGQDYLGSMRSGNRVSGPTSPQPGAPGIPTPQRLLGDGGPPQTPPAASNPLPPGVLEAEVVGDHAPASPSSPAVLDKPTHVKEGSQVSGMDESGNLVSGKLEKLYPKLANGKPGWFGTVLDVKNGKTLDLPADRLFDRLKGPPSKSEGPLGGQKNNSKPLTRLSDEEGPFTPPTKEELAGPWKGPADRADQTTSMNESWRNKQQRLMDDAGTQNYQSRVRERPTGWRPVVLDANKVARPEEMALLRESTMRIAEQNPHASKLASRIEIKNSRQISLARGPTLATTAIAYYDPDTLGSRITINIDHFRSYVAQHGVEGAKALLEHEMTHAAQHFLKKSEPGMNRAGLEDAALRRESKSLAKDKK